MVLVSEIHKSETPFEPLGKRIKRLRISHQQSLAEVSGAIEIDPEKLAVIERGLERPNEDILALIISYFELKEEEADNLWQLAGYETETIATKTPVMVLPEDLRIVYTDIANVMVNDFGVIMNFMQTTGPGGQPLAIARVGMSREHAQQVLAMLEKTLRKSPKQLPAPRKTPGK